MLEMSLIILPTTAESWGLRSWRGAGWDGDEGVRDMVMLVKRPGKRELADMSTLTALRV